MSLNFTEQRTGPRYLVHINVRAEWDDAKSGEHIVVEGETENIGPQGALVHLERLPDVGSRVHLIVPDAEGKTLNIDDIEQMLRGVLTEAQLHRHEDLVHELLPEDAALWLERGSLALGQRP